MVKDLFGHDAWGDSIDMADEAVSKGNFGAFRMTGSDLDAICAARESLIRRWHGNKCDVKKTVLTQAREYMALGHLAGKHLSNPLIVGGDSVAMAGFLQGLATPQNPLPAIYLRTKHY